MDISRPAEDELGRPHDVSPERRCGPLAAPGVGGRVAPFAAVGAVIVASIGLGGIPRSTWVAAGLLFVALVAAALWLPWRRWPADWQGTIALAGLGVVLVMHHSAVGSAAGYLPVTCLPIVWLALYHSGALLVAGLVELAVGLALVEWVGGPSGASERWQPVLLTVAATSLMGGTVFRLVSNVRRGSRALAESNHRVAAERNFVTGILQGVASLVCVLNHRGQIQFFNRQCEETLGREAAEVLGRPYWRVGLSPDHPGELDEVARRLSETGVPASYEDDWSTGPGQRRRISWTIAPLHDGHGRIVQYVAMGLDVTAQRQTERLFRYIRSTATEYAIVAIDTEGTITVFNAGAERLFGYQSGEVVGRRSVVMLYPPEFLAERMATLAVADELSAIVHDVQPGTPHTDEVTLVHKDGSQIPVALSLNAILDDRNQILGYLGAARDITVERQASAATLEALHRERQASARLRELAQEQSTFVTTVSHELRTPLTSIMGNTELLMNNEVGALSPQQQRVLGAVERNAGRLMALVANLLTVSKLDAVEVAAERQSVDVRVVVEGALDALVEMRRKHRVRLDISLPDRPVRVFGDQHALELVAINLIGNALKFTPDGGTVEVDLTQTNAAATLVVRDTGLGIPEADLPHVFERFFRSSTSRKHEVQGTGLGLAITKAIVEQHNGAISLASRPGEGTTVTVLLLAEDALVVSGAAPGRPATTGPGP